MNQFFQSVSVAGIVTYLLHLMLHLLDYDIVLLNASYNIYCTFGKKINV